MAKKPSPKVILNPDVADDCEEELGSPIPDDEGWVYLKRDTAQDQQRAKKPMPKKRPC